MDEKIMFEAMAVIKRLLQEEPNNQGLLDAQEMIYDIIQGFLI
jgi:hypothetical protein